MNVIHYCPYCGDEDLWPQEGHGTWRCRACTRTFAIRIVKDQEQLSEHRPHPDHP